MSEATNLAVVEQFYAAFQRKDLQAILALQTEDSEWSVAAPPDLIPWASPGRGPAGVTKFLSVLAQWLVPEVFEIRTYLAREETVVALGFQRGIVRPTREPYAFDFVHVWTLAAGKVRSFRVYYDTAYVGSLVRQESAQSSAGT
jgi:uncharacterized protein